MIGTGTRAADRLFVGWSGPRGLATIVFAVLVLDAKLPGTDTILLAAGWTVLISVVAHGITANPLVRAIGGRADERPAPVIRERTRTWPAPPCLSLELDMNAFHRGAPMTRARSAGRSRIVTIVAATMVALSLAAHRAAIAGSDTAAAAQVHPRQLLTLKERLGAKWTDEQRVDNCNVPPDKRGPKPRPDTCSNPLARSSARER